MHECIMYGDLMNVILRNVIPTGCTSEMHFEIRPRRFGPSACPPARLPAAPLILPADLKEQLLAVDVVDQESVVLVHHGQLVAGGAHVQAAHGRGQLEQRDGELVVDKDLQDLHHVRTHTDTHTHKEHQYCSQYKCS